jgi:mannose-6-phosphate isomerase-like protein (cupin superfamily)
VFVKNINDCPEFTANDGCLIREWIHPKNDSIALPYSVAMATVEIGKQSYEHKLEQTEVCIVFSGEGIMHIDDEEQEVSSGEAILVPAGAIQWIENTGDEELSFIAIVSPPWSEAGDIRLNE